MGLSRIGVAAASVLAAGATLVSAGPAGAAAPTHVVRVRPVTASGHLKSGYSISAKRSQGNCWTSSDATGSAYRCMAHNEICDPCWVGAHKAYVYCLPAAWSHEVVRLHVTKGYDNTGFPWRSAKYPWGMRVADGERCSLEQGATGEVHGKGISYGCDSKT